MGAQTIKKSAPPRFHPILYGVAPLLVALIFLGAGYAYAFDERILPNTSIWGVPLSGKTKERADAIVTSIFTQSVNIPVTVSVRGTQRAIPLKELGVNLDAAKTVDDVWANGHTGSRAGGIINRFKALAVGRKVTARFAIDQDKLKSAVQTQFGDQLRDANDARFVLEGSTIKVVEAEEGYIIDPPAILTSLSEGLKSGKFDSLTIAPRVTTPSITTAMAKAILPQAQALVERAPVRMRANSRVLTVSEAVIFEWLKLSLVGGVADVILDQDKIKAYVTELAQQLYQKPVARQVNERNGDVLEEGVDGTALNEEATIEALVALQKQDAPNALELVMQTVPRGEKKIDPLAGAPEGGQFAGKYIDIDLSEQKLYLFDGQNLVNSFLISTGKWSTPTPTGTFSIQNKVEVAYSAVYGLYMPNWMAITSDGKYGIHGLPYSSTWSEDPSHLGSPRSHGCIRVGDIMSVYGWIDIGNPVVIHG